MSGDFQFPAAILPHSYPFVLIDRIVERKEGKSIVCLKNVTFNEEFFRGLLAGDQVMPDVLILEAMAQACGLIIGSSQSKAAFLSGISDAEFRKAVMPGDQLVIKASLIREFEPLYLFGVSSCVKDTVVAEAEITISIK